MATLLSGKPTCAKLLFSKCPSPALLSFAYIINADLLGRDLVSGGPQVDLLVDVHAGDDEEHARAPGAARQQPPQSEPGIIMEAVLDNVFQYSE